MAIKTNERLREDVGQLMIMGFDGTALDERLRAMLTTLQPAGVILFKRNIATAAQTHALLRDAQKALGRPIFRCVDMEGGTVDRFRDVLGRVPSAWEVAQTGSERIFRKHGELIGRQLRALGFNTDFAPCIDLRLPESLSVLGGRAVSSNPEEVVQYARPFLAGLRAKGILGCGKHFPGLGGANLDSHHAMPVVGRNWNQAWNEDLRPYREMHRDFPFIMVAHVAYSKITGANTPASLSKKWITDVLRAKVLYRGLIVSDDLDMGGVLNRVTVEEAAVASLKAGCDMFLVCQKEESVWRAYEAVLNRAEHDPAFARMLAHKAQRVTKLQKEWTIVQAKMTAAPTDDKVEVLRRLVVQFTDEVRHHSPTNSVQDRPR